jgi:hypothetical protein
VSGLVVCSWLISEPRFSPLAWFSVDSGTSTHGLDELSACDNALSLM